MRLAALLAALSEEDLGRLALEHVRTEEPLDRPLLCNSIETALRSYRFVSHFITSRQPPTFSILSLLLDSPGFSSAREDFKERVLADTARLTELVNDGYLTTRDHTWKLYRRALCEARRNDLDLNSSEAALLAVLRRECGIALVHHFLMEHHEDFREVWDREDAFEHEMKALRSAGLVFVTDDQVVIPEEVAPAIRHSLGVEMPTASARRLLNHLSSGELADVLDTVGSSTSGSKEARLDRLLVEHVQPSLALKCVGLTTLREICRSANASARGNKHELIDRIVVHFAEGKDQFEEEPLEPPRRETRRLDEQHFGTLFNALQHQELTDILRRLPHLRQTGAKEIRIRTLWDAHLSEATLLGELRNRQLEDILLRVGLRIVGPKGTRIERIIHHFETAGSSHIGSSITVSTISATPVGPIADDSEVVSNQSEFRQRSSNPQASLQPWLEELFDGQGMIRCYATDDANPTKQLKNKLSQAAAARDGFLVLLLADESSYLKAREALEERWMSNAEWSKSVACVGLAYPIGTPTLVAMIQRIDSKWPETIRGRLFPSAEVVKAKGSPNESCSKCGNVLHEDARYCPSCGTEANRRGLE